MTQKSLSFSYEAAPEKNFQLSAAVNTLKKDDKTTSFGGISNFDPNNRFRYYQQLVLSSAYVSVPLWKLGLMLSKGLEFDGKKQVLKDFDLWRKKQNFDEQVATVGRLLCRDGTYIASPVGDALKFSMQPLLMPYTTVLPEGVDLKAKPDDVMMYPIDRIVVGEDKNAPVIRSPDELVYGSVNAWDYVQEDIRQRETYGIYGSSLLDPIELSIRNLLNINKGFVSFVKRYGMGRYHYDHVMLEKLVETGAITPDKASDIHTKWLENNKSLSENEDISAVGLKVTPIDAHGSLNVQEFKESLETEIQLGLFQSPLTMGKAAGTTYASGFLVEEDRLVVLEGLQRILENIVNQIINKRLTLMGKTEDSVSVKFEELSKIKLTAAEVQEMFNTGVIEREEFRHWGGFYLVTSESGETNEPATVKQKPQQL